MAKYLIQSGGGFAEAVTPTTSAGAGDSGKIPGLDASGRLDGSFLPVGIGADTGPIQASEALAAGDLVNTYDGGAGAFRARKADASTNGKRAHGFVLASVSSGATATIYYEGTDTAQTSVPAGELWLSTTPGKVTATPPSGSGQTVQRVGFGVSTSAFNFQAGDPIVLA